MHFFLLFCLVIFGFGFCGFWGFFWLVIVLVVVVLVFFSPREVTQKKQNSVIANLTLNCKGP